MMTTLAADVSAPCRQLAALAEEWGVGVTEEEFAKRMDSADELACLREMFLYPKNKNLPDGEMVNREVIVIVNCGKVLHIG